MQNVKVFKASLSNLGVMLNYVEEIARGTGFSDGDINKIRLACEEILVNVINYAYPKVSKSKSIEITCKTKKGKNIAVIIKDDGIAFNPLKAGNVDTTLPLEQRPIGGLGIFFFLNIMDKFDYKRVRNSNILTMTKKM